MPSHNNLVQSAVAHGVQPGTQLQDAMLKTRRSRRRAGAEFEIALGELFVVGMDACRTRNGLKIKLQLANKVIEELKAEIESLEFQLANPQE